LELRDITDHKSAQHKLDQIMSDSRPPAGYWPLQNYHLVL
jgi:hypothetical protein